MSDTNRGKSESENNGSKKVNIPPKSNNSGNGNLSNEINHSLKNEIAETSMTKININLSASLIKSGLCNMLKIDSIIT